MWEVKEMMKRDHVGGQGDDGGIPCGRVEQIKCLSIITPRSFSRVHIL